MRVGSAPVDSKIEAIPAPMKMRTLALVCFLAMFMISRTGWASFSIFLNMSNIAGDSVVSGHTSDVTLQSFEVDMAKYGTQQPSFSLSLSKNVSLNSPTFAIDCANGTTNQTATISFYANNGTLSTTAFYSVAVSNVVVTSDSVSGTAGGTTLTEDISLSFKSITWTYVPQNGGGVYGTPIVTSYNSP
jgi:type VI protein secretion system component Hcp